MDYYAARTDLIALRFALGARSVLTFPLSQAPAGHSDLHSPRAGHSHNITPFDFSKYEEYLWEVKEVRDMVSNGIYPYQFLRKYYPAHWGELCLELPKVLRNEGLSHEDPQGCANVVHMDKPIDLGFAIMNYLGETKRADRLIVGNTGHVDFIERGPRLIADMARQVQLSLDKAFDVKYYYGVARPEEVYEKLTGNPGKGITQYSDMSYNHPSYPAGHGSAAGATGKFFFDYCNLSPEERIEIRSACYLWAMFRTFAGVHFAVDNLAGLLEVGGLE